MRKRLIETLAEVIAAEEFAAELRRTYGSAAEERCDAMMSARAQTELERERLKDVRRALRWI